MAKQFLNSIYVRKIFGDDKFKKRKVMLSQDYLVEIIKDLTTGEKKIEYIEQPEIPYYMAINPPEYQQIYIDKDKVREVNTKYADREYNMAIAIGKKDEFLNACKNNNKYMFVRAMYESPYLYSADIDIEDYYKTKFMVENGSDLCKEYHKAFTDIEVDTYHYSGFPEPDIAPCPISVINHIDQKLKRIFSFILINHDNFDQIKEVMDDPTKFLIENIEEDILKEFSFDLRFLETEQEVIASYFTMIHETKPDFVGIWNMRFDAVTILNRMKQLHMDVLNTLCHPDVPDKYKHIYYNKEEIRMNFSATADASEDSKHPSRRFDWFSIVGYTQFYDQMSLYSNLRKRTLLPSYKLDDISHSELGFGKTDIYAMGYTIKNVYVKNFKLFLKYGFKDVYVQYRLEKKVEDLDKFIMYCGNTRLSKGTKISIIIRNILMKIFTEKGKVIGNTVSYDVFEKAVGAIVAKPELIEQMGEEILGKETFLFNNVIDLDAASEYPSLMIAFNITKSSIYGRVYGVQDENGVEISSGDDINKAMETLDTSLFDLCEKYFGLPSIDTLFTYIEANAEKLARIGK